MPRIVLDSCNLAEAERALVAGALAEAGSIVAQLLGITRKAVARLIVKHRIEWPRGYQPQPPGQPVTLRGPS